MYQNISNLILTKSKKIAIIMHARPDADALGSSLALGGILKKLGHKVEIISPDEYPKFLYWLKDIQNVLVYKNEEKKCQEIINNFDILFCLDFSNLSRLNEVESIVLNSKILKIVIDHHIDPQNFGKISIIDIKASATAILIFRLLKKLDLLKLLDTDLANCLYAGIMTDTGSFQNPNTNAESHLITSELINYKANISEVSKNIYNVNSIDKIKFLGFALSKRLVIIPNYKTAYFYLSKKDCKKYNLKIGDTEGLVNYALSIKDICIAALIAEKEDCIRISLRSQGNIHVNEIAKKYFMGGGHKNAAGGKSFVSLSDTIEKFEKVIKNPKEILNICH